MYSLRLEEIDLRNHSQKNLSVQLSIQEPTIQRFLWSITAVREYLYIFVDGEFMNGMIYTRRIIGDTSDSLINVVKNFESMMNEN